MALNDNQDNYGSPWSGGDYPQRRRVFDSEPPRRSKLGLIIIILLILVGIGVAAYFWFSAPGGASVSLDFSSIDEVMLGQPFSTDVSFSNNSDKILKNAKLSLSLPDGVYLVGEDKDQRIKEITIGDIGPGSLNKETFDLIVTGEAHVIKNLTAKLNYAVAPSDAVFEENADADVSVGDSVIGLNIETPKSVFSGEDLKFKIKYQNNNASALKNISMKVNYPNVFKFDNSSVPPDASNNVWNFDALDKNESGEILIGGSVISQEGSFASFNIQIEEKFAGQVYVISTQTAQVGISVAPLSISIELNGSDDYLPKLSDTLHYVLKYKNNSNFLIQNIKIQAQFIGELFDFSSAKSDASFNSLTNTFLWAVANDTKLASLSPGEEDSVFVDVRTKPNYPIRRISDKNFTLKVGAQIESPTVPEGTVAQKTVSVTNFESKIPGQVSLDSRAYFRDAGSGIVNSGVFPPKVNKATQYTIHWIIKNYSTDISNVKVSSFLQSGAVFTGKIKSNITEAPVYNPNTNQVTWDIASINATRGVVGSPIEAIFQISVTPAINQIGQIIDLLGDAKITAIDNFTSSSLVDIAQKVDTYLPYDTTVSSLDHRVQP